MEWNIEDWTFEGTHFLGWEYNQENAATGYRSMARENETGRYALGHGGSEKASVEALKKGIRERYWEGKKRGVIVKEWNENS